jgi:AcrR family transcriptional regulator
MARSEPTESVTLIWERPEPEGRGTAPAPDRARILDAAFEIADREGLHAVSVKRVASKLHVPAARLEAYLTSRDDLLDLMLDGAFGEIEPADEGPDWRSRLRAIAHATQVTAQRHPWLRSLAGTRTPSGPNGLRHSERALAALADLGLDATTMTQAVNTVLAYVYGYVQLEMLDHSRKADADAEAARKVRTAQYLLEQVQTGEYPTLARVFSDASLSADDTFETGLNYVLDGIATRVPGGPADHGTAAGGGDSMAENQAAAQADAANGEPHARGGRFGRRRSG